MEAQRPRLRAKTLYETKRYLHGHWKQLRDVPVHKIERRDVAARVAEIKTDSGPIAAARARTVLSTLFAWAIGEGFAEHYPIAGQRRAPW